MSLHWAMQSPIDSCNQRSLVEQGASQTPDRRRDLDAHRFRPEAFFCRRSNIEARRRTAPLLIKFREALPIYTVALPPGPHTPLPPPSLAAVDASAKHQRLIGSKIRSEPVARL